MTPETSTIRRGHSMVDRITDLRTTLRKQAYLYDSPHDFRAGVDAALNALQREAFDLELESMFATLDVND